MAERLGGENITTQIKTFERKLKPALLSMGDKHILKEYRHLWSPKNPTFGYCYVITELLHRHLSEIGIRSTPKKIPTREGSHWYLVLENGRPVDLAKDQHYDYSKGRDQSFRRKGLSKRAALLGNLMGIR